MIRSGVVGKTGRIRLKGAALTALRHAVYLRIRGKCSECGIPIIEEAGRWQSMHLSHDTSRGAGGSDVPENTDGLCINCHLVSRHRPKSVPGKRT